VSVTKRDLLPVETLKDLLAESHALVAAKLPKKKRQKLGLAD
jgi:predicted DNA-binding protein (MmcQ/YjbR family)